MNSNLITKNLGFEWGINNILSRKTDNNILMDFDIVRLKKGEVFGLNNTNELSDRLEYACLLLDGEASFQVEDQSGGFETSASRQSLFEQDPSVVNIGVNSVLSIKAESDLECAIVATDNQNELEPKFYNADNMLESERRGHGLLNNTAYRIVRTVFDKRNNPKSNLVIGEVINFPGCWSSYPPHFHEQPEIYHYRFTEPQGYGHAELGDEVLKVKNFDTVKILDNNTHSQVAAPGYGMYYIWMIRHLENNPYTVPVFEQQHSWTKESEANSKVWQG